MHDNAVMSEFQASRMYDRVEAEGAGDDEIELEAFQSRLHGVEIVRNIEKWYVTCHSSFIYPHRHTTIPATHPVDRS